MKARPILFGLLAAAAGAGVDGRAVGERGATTGVAGGGLRVCNGTPVSLHLALTLVGPTYYENWVGPGECMVRDGIGNFWFGIQAKVASWTNRMNDFTDSDVAIPMICLVCSLVACACLVALRLTSAAARLASEKEPGLAGRTLLSNRRSSSLVAAVARGQPRIRKCLVTAACAFGVLGGVLVWLTVRERILRRHHWIGFYANCKSWTIAGDIPTFHLAGELFPDFNQPHRLWYEGGAHYDCHSGGSDRVEVDESLRVATDGETTSQTSSDVTGERGLKTTRAEEDGGAG